MYINDPCCVNSPHKCISLAAMLLFTPYETTWLIAIKSQSGCITCHRCLRSAATCDKPPTAVTWSEPSSTWYSYAIKANFRIIRSQVSQPPSAGHVGLVDLVNCKLITAWYQNSEPSFCAAWVSYRQINYQCKLQCGGFATLRKSWEILVNPDAVGYQTTAVIIAYWLINQRFQNFFNRDRNLSLVNILRPKSQTAYVNMTKMLIVWTSFGSRLLSSFSTSAFYSFLKYLRCITNRHRQTYKFEKIQVRLRFWSPLRDLFS